MLYFYKMRIKSEASKPFSALQVQQCRIILEANSDFRDNCEPGAFAANSEAIKMGAPRLWANWLGVKGCVGQ